MQFRRASYLASALASALVLAGAGGSPVVAQCDLTETEKLTASDGAPGDRFGIVSVSGDVAIIGAPNDDDGGSASGSAYVFRYDGATWVQEQKLTASDDAATDQFGAVVSISGDVVIVGARNDDDNGSASGSAYVFRHDGATWVEEQKLTASDGAADDQFGYAVSISGDVAIVGAYLDDDNGSASGSAYAFRYDGATWVEEQKLVAPDGAAVDYFGFAVSISGDAAIVGSVFDDDNGGGSGSAYVFRHDKAKWALDQKLVPADGAEGDNLGFAVSISGDVAIAGAYLDDDNGSSSGSASVFRYDGATWVEEPKLLASDGATRDEFGKSVSISGDLAIVGAARDDDNGDGAGAAYVYRHDGATWVEESKLLASDGTVLDLFGIVVAIDGDRAFVGALSDDDNGDSSGSAYVFELTACLCPADLDDDGMVGFDDLTAVLAAWGDKGGPEDLDASGTVDFEDLLIVLDAWGPCA